MSKNALKKYILRVEVNQALFPTKMKIQFSIFLMHFWTLVNRIPKNVVCLVVLHVKLQQQWIKNVEMRSKTV
jgi:hypothetical protein